MHNSTINQWNTTMQLQRTAISLFLVFLAVCLAFPTRAAAYEFRAGAAAIDITPSNFPVIIAGYFLEARASQVVDPLFVRCFAFDDGQTKIVLAVVDSCMVEAQLIDQAKQLASQRTGIPTDRMTVSATHTHAAPSAKAGLGTRRDKIYVARLPGLIADGIAKAVANLQPARVGWAVIDDWEHTHNRRWIRNLERKVQDPFGDVSGIANMHPGYLSRDVIGPSGAVDPALAVLAAQTLDGKPLAVLANYSQHYFGGGPVSADYYGEFCRHVANLWGLPGEGNGPFVCAMSQGTSGDLQWPDYGEPAEKIDRDTYAAAVARYAHRALRRITYQDSATLTMVEKRLKLKYRVPNKERLAWARPIAEKIENEVPKDLTEVYANEAVILDARQSTELKLQVIRIGDLTICALPNEVYAVTGLKLRAQTPGQVHFNLGLANGAEGYIPPPEQHALGGYTTWPARSAGLEVNAEPKMVTTLVEALGEVTGKPPRIPADEDGPYSKAIRQAQPRSWWRLNDIKGRIARNAVGGAPPAELSPGFAWYLPGPGSGTGIGSREMLTPSAFSGPRQINRAVHLAGGELRASVGQLGGQYSVALWVWLGEASGASERSGMLIAGPRGESLVCRQDDDHQVQLLIGEVASQASMRADDWHFVVLQRDGDQLSVFVDGRPTPQIADDATATAGGSEFVFGAGLQGKLDEIAIFDHLLTPTQINELWQLSGVSEHHVAHQEALSRHGQTVLPPTAPPKFAANYADAIAQLAPVEYQSLATAPERMTTKAKVKYSERFFATFAGGHIRRSAEKPGSPFSASFWICNEKGNEADPGMTYCFSRGRDGDTSSGDSLGIGNNLWVFNGNSKKQSAAGTTRLGWRSWNHVVMVHDGKRVRVFLNGAVEPEIDADVAATAPSPSDYFFGARNDGFAPLLGMMAHIALFDRALTGDEAQTLHAASGLAAGKPATPPVANRVAAAPPESDPVSPTVALKKNHVPAGYRLELAACEPQVLDPVAFDWDPSGRLWVVEMADYPLGTDGKGKSGGRIRVLEDRDRDGHFETSRLFASDLNFPNGILTWRDGVLVTAAPEILFLRDTDGDGKADSTEVLIQGFSEGNQQLRVNGLRWGLDGWVYCAGGGHHPSHAAGTRIESTRSGIKLELGSRDFRFHPDSGAVEPESGPTQFGRNRDAWGHWFGTQNVMPLWHYVLADRYSSRNPYVPMPPPTQRVVSPDSWLARIYPASSQQKRFHSFKEAGHFTSACGGMIYNDNLLFVDGPPQHAFTCEPFHNLVQHNVIEDAGVSYVSHRAPGEEDRDFFASEDRWCRPVMARTGPDGALWIADMYRYMIEHPAWLPAEGRAELLPHYRLGEYRGRIYRVVAEGAAPRKPVRLDKVGTAGLVAALDSPNDWQRDKAQQLLLWKADAAATALLEQLVRSNPRPQTRVQALSTLDCTEGLTSELLCTALADPTAGVKENALRISEAWGTDAKVVAAAVRLANDPDAKVRLQLALSLGEWPASDAASDALAQIAVSGAAEPLLVAAVMSSALPYAPALTPAILRAEQTVVDTYREPLLRLALGAKEVAVTAEIFAAALAKGPALAMRDFTSLVSVLEQAGTSWEQLAAAPVVPAMTAVLADAEKLFEVAKRTAEDEDVAADERIAAAALLGRIPAYRSAAVESLSTWLRPQIGSDLQQSVLESLNRSGADQVPEVLGEAWEAFSPALREQALDLWLSRNRWTEDLLDRIEKGSITSGMLDPARRDRLLRHPSETIAGRAANVFDSTGSVTRAAVIAEYRSCLELAADPERGKAAYVKGKCGTCHRRGSEGAEIGPNLATVLNHPPEKLLGSILDPNAEINPGYQRYNCQLESGLIVSGLLTAETSNSVTIKLEDGSIKTLARAQIEFLQNSSLSLMPEGLEKTLGPQELADLIALLRTAPADGDAAPEASN